MTDSSVDGVMFPWDARGARLYPTKRQAKLFAPTYKGSPNTTRAGELLTTALAAAPTSTKGIVIGRDQLSHAVVAHDAVTAYEAGDITSPLTLIIGDVGRGKSSLIKTVYVLRALTLRNRRCVVIDKKDEGGEGEYGSLTRQFGSEPIRLRLDGEGSTINPIDPLIAGHEISAPERTLQALIENIAGVQLGVWERRALRHALRSAQDSLEGRRVATLEDVAHLLGTIRPDVLAKAGSATDTFDQSAMFVRFAVEELLETYGTMFSGETSRGVDLADKLTTFDVSQLPDSGPAVAAAVGVAHGWLMGTLRRQRGKTTHFIAEEGWHLLNGPNARVIGGANVKLARGYGLVMIIALHKPSDIELNNDAAPVFAEAQTVHIFGNSRLADAQKVVDMFDLDADSTEAIMHLPKGHHLLKIGTRPEIHVQHVRSPLETELTNTDAAMLARSSATETTNTYQGATA